MTFGWRRRLRWWTCAAATATRVGKHNVRPTDDFTRQPLVMCRLKLLGINISDDLRWDAYVDALCAKVASRLYFSKILKRSGLQQKDLLCFHKSVIRAVVEYGCVVWHHNLHDHCTERSFGGSSKTCSTHYFAPSDITIQFCPRFLWGGSSQTATTQFPAEIL